MKKIILSLVALLITFSAPAVSALTEAELDKLDDSYQLQFFRGHSLPSHCAPTTWFHPSSVK